eukprot:CAMPEP_0197256176 /NCGR_PEP_ID=MMETSP1429-20130617/74528_1 /TAXON_ID=49237 /ORGANISM="Chaetoceros  sp., Strain UNC1202" /LENGTH=82 /DNA_ID=CAMNT_0042719675 /DNA_START=247 /DNA_END=492 /DNA_ORIENTATION=+
MVRMVGALMDMASVRRVGQTLRREVLEVTEVEVAQEDKVATINMEAVPTDLHEKMRVKVATTVAAHSNELVTATILVHHLHI